MKRIIVLGLILGFIVIISCGKKEGGKSEAKVTTIVLNKSDDTNDMNWNEIFTEEEIIFSYPDANYKLLSIPSLLITGKGDYIIPDGYSKSIKLFDRTGKFLKVIGNWGGQGPGEFKIIGALVLNNEDDLFIFDVNNYRLNKFVSPNYVYSDDRKYLKVNPSSLIITPQNHFITYTFSEYMLKKWDSSGNFIKKDFRPTANLRIFTYRFNLGGIVDHNGKGFFMVYPENYEIRYYDYDLTLKKIMKTEKYSKFRPKSHEFPEKISPFDFSPQHLNWWEKFLHVARIYVIRDNIICISLYESEKKSFKNYYLNIYSIDGKIYSEGLKVPHNGIVRYAKDGYVYVSVAPQLGHNDEVISPKLYRYRFRK